MLGLPSSGEIQVPFLDEGLEGQMGEEIVDSHQGPSKTLGSCVKWRFLLYNVYLQLPILSQFKHAKNPMSSHHPSLVTSNNHNLGLSSLRPWPQHLLAAAAGKCLWQRNRAFQQHPACPGRQVFDPIRLGVRSLFFCPKGSAEVTCWARNL